MANLNQTVTDNIKTAMAIHGIKRKDIAAQINRSGEYVRLHLNGTFGWTINDMEGIAALLGLPATNLLDPASRRTWLSNPYMNLARDHAKAFALLVEYASSCDATGNGVGVIDPLKADLLARSIDAKEQDIKLLHDLKFIETTPQGILIRTA